ncbi:Ribose import permease protein RbsC [subsurface metagenome]
MRGKGGAYSRKCQAYIFNLRKFKLQWGILLVFLLLIILFIIGSPRTFLSSRIYIAVMSTVPFAGVMALGLTFVVVSGMIDLSFPSVMAISGFIFAVIFTSTGSAGLALVSGLSTGLVAGVLNGVMVTRIGVPPIVATIGTMFLWRGVAHVASGGVARVLGPVRDTALFSVLAGRVGGVIPAQFLWMLLIVVVLWFILNRHRFGNDVCFVGDNESSARMMGINVGRTKIFVFALMGLLAAFAGVMNDLEMVNWWPSQGEGHFLPVFAMLFVGGTSITGGRGTIFGTLIGAFIIGILEAGIIASGFSGFWTQLIYGLIIIISVSMHTMMRK